MIKKREFYKIVIFEPAKSRMQKNQCPGCAKPRKDWTRRKDWRCCSVDCTIKYQKMYVTYNWPELRMKALKRDKFTCVKCGKKPKGKVMDTRLDKHGRWEYYWKESNDNSSELIGDHIIPIALGGDQWDLKNIQTLCLSCNKIKTKEDQKNISVVRRRIKLQTPELKI